MAGLRSKKLCGRSVNECQIVGITATPSSGQAFLWTPGSEMRLLGTLTGGTFSDAKAVNGLGNQDGCILTLKAPNGVRYCVLRP